MAEKPGRPPVYQSKDEKPATVSLRIPRDLYKQAQKYVQQRSPMTLTELLLDGLRLRLETPADPRDIILSDDNTVMQELQEMIQTAVQAEIGKLNTFMGSAFDALKLAPASEAAAAPVSELSHNGNAVIQQEAPRRPGRQSTLRQPIVDLLREHREGLSAVQIKVLLGVDKNIGDTLAGMVRDHVIEKKGSGKDVRYLAVTAEGMDTRVRSKAKPQATSKSR